MKRGTKATVLTTAIDILDYTKELFGNNEQFAEARKEFENGAIFGVTMLANSFGIDIDVKTLHKLKEIIKF